VRPIQNDVGRDLQDDIHKEMEEEDGKQVVRSVHNGHKTWMDFHAGEGQSILDLADARAEDEVCRKHAFLRKGPARARQVSHRQSRKKALFPLTKETE